MSYGTPDVLSGAASYSASVRYDISPPDIYVNLQITITEGLDGEGAETDKDTAFQAAIDALAAHPDLVVTGASKVYPTSVPVTPTA